jgi:hypothetical protein
MFTSKKLLYDSHWVLVSGALSPVARQKNKFFISPLSDCGITSLGFICRVIFATPVLPGA